MLSLLEPRALRGPAPHSRIARSSADSTRGRRTAQAEAEPGRCACCDERVCVLLDTARGLFNNAMVDTRNTT